MAMRSARARKKKKKTTSCGGATAPGARGTERCGSEEQRRKRQAASGDKTLERRKRQMIWPGGPAQYAQYHFAIDLKFPNRFDLNWIDFAKRASQFFLNIRFPILTIFCFPFFAGGSPDRSLPNSTYVSIKHYSRQLMNIETHTHTHKLTWSTQENYTWVPNAAALQIVTKEKVCNMPLLLYEPTFFWNHTGRQTMQVMSSFHSFLIQ
jgi:hypothetical protein